MENLASKLLEALDFFVYVFTELAVLFILISFLVGLIQQFITPERIKHWLDARNGRGYAIGAALGALSPFCSCSTIPIMTGLLKARAGFGPTMSFLFSSPLISPVIVTLFASLIGIKLTVIYVLMSLGLAVAAGYLLQKARIRAPCAPRNRRRLRNPGSLLRRWKPGNRHCGPRPGRAPAHHDGRIAARFGRTRGRLLQPGGVH